MSDFSNEGFIQEFLEEAREHLFKIHDALLSLERSITQMGGQERALPRQETVEQLFRSFHTLKGLSGMIGLQPAAQLSHSMESVLLGIQKTEIEITSAVLQVLFDGVEKLEAVIATLSNPETELPRINAETAALSDLISGTTPVPAPSSAAGTAAPISIEPFLADILEPFPEIRAGLNEVDYPAILEAIIKGHFLTLGIFIPSADRSEEGINVGRIREELANAGLLIKSIPLVAGTTVRFAFLLASSNAIVQDQYPYLTWAVLLPGRKSDQQEVVPTFPDLGAAPEALSRIAATNLLRVDLHRLDELIELVGQLILQRSSLVELMNGLTQAAPALRRDFSQKMVQMDRTLRQLRDAVLRTRMVPLAEVFSQMPLAIRDQARVTGKDVQLIVSGEDTEIDKVLVERLFDPLLHLVRNAITHGLETPAERRAARKPERGCLTLQGKPEGDHILVEVSDDGRGIDRAKVAQRASELGLIDSGQFISDADVLDLICRPGFSTQAIADLDAGRGVGMDVVRRMVNTMGGALSMTTQPDQGTTFTLRLPLSLVILDAILVRSAKEVYAVPQGLIEEVIEINLDNIVQVEGGEMLSYKETALVIYRLANLFNLPQDEHSRPKSSHSYGLVANFGDQRTAILVDQLIGLREVVIRPVNDPLIACPGVTGATELSNGQVVLMINPSDLMENAKRKQVSP
jgi:two-component system, chemotaxis family, sensor kinase CheA